jgi:hypothetical protein
MFHFPCSFENKRSPTFQKKKKTFCFKKKDVVEEKRAATAQVLTLDFQVDVRPGPQQTENFVMNCVLDGEPIHADDFVTNL